MLSHKSLFAPKYVNYMARFLLFSGRIFHLKNKTACKEKPYNVNTVFIWRKLFVFKDTGGAESATEISWWRKRFTFAFSDFGLDEIHHTK